jgi:glycosyltransferase involved in cell wall biosynthesis
MVNENPLVSVCIPCYNAEKYIAETLDSVICQTYQNLEIIVCDDESTDNTLKIIQSYKDPRIKLFSNEQNLGLIGNYNRVLEQASGKYVVLQCADDLWNVDNIEKKIDIFESNVEKNVVLVTSEKTLINSEGKPLFRKSFPGKKGRHNGVKIVKKMLRLGMNIIGEPGATLIPAEVIKKVGLIEVPQNLTYFVEFDWWCRILMHGDIYVIKEPLFSYRIVETSDSVKNRRWKQAKNFNEYVSLFDKKILKISWFDKCSAFIFSWIMCIARNVIYAFVNKK